MDYKDYNDNELLMYIEENNEDANEIMYKKYYPIIREYALKLYSKAKTLGLDFNDLIQEGMLGLNIAINHYNDKEETRFYTFACTCIKRRMLSFLVASGGKKNLLLNESISFDYEDEETYKTDYILCDKSSLTEDIVCDKIFTNELLVSLSKKLSKLEKRILSLKIKGLQYKEISKYINKDYKTIDNAIQRIRAKINKTIKELN